MPRFFYPSGLGCPPGPGGYCHSRSGVRAVLLSLALLLLPSGGMAVVDNGRSTPPTPPLPQAKPVIDSEAAPMTREKTVLESLLHRGLVALMSESPPIPRPKPLDELLLAAQPERVAAVLEGLAPQRPGVVDLYAVAFGGYGHEAVFKREVLYTRWLFEDRLAIGNRIVTLINHPSTANRLPLATTANLASTLTGLAKIMDPEEDILLVFLTSHGSEDHALSVALEQLPLADLPAQTLATLLNDVPIQWQVVVISACYSGGFIEPLMDEQRLIITAARSDRPSFGCSDDAEFTYFGRALLANALHETDSFTEAFQQAKTLVTRWEEEQGFSPSEPQMASSPAIEAHLQRWREQR